MPRSHDPRGSACLLAGPARSHALHGSACGLVVEPLRGLAFVSDFKPMRGKPLRPNPGNFSPDPSFALCGPQLSVPVIAAVGGVLLLGEPITPRLLLASVAILGGIALVILAKQRSIPSST